MINNETHRNAFINSAERNLNHTNSLKHLLNDSEDEHDEHDIISLSTYTDVKTLRKRMSVNNSALSIRSLNVQSINAKFDELKITIDQLNKLQHTVSVICTQESLLEGESNIDLYQLDNYNPISKGKYCSGHGGLMIYLQIDFEYEQLPDIVEHTTGWEQFFLNIKHINLTQRNTSLAMYIVYQMNLLVIAITLPTGSQIF